MSKSEKAFRTITEAAEELELPAHVLRFWESKFKYIKPMKRGGGRRYYRPKDLDILYAIKHLLYSEGVTIRRALKIIQTNGIKSVVRLSIDKNKKLSAESVTKEYEENKISKQLKWPHSLYSVDLEMIKNIPFNKLGALMSDLEYLRDSIKDRCIKSGLHINQQMNTE